MTGDCGLRRSASARFRASASRAAARFCDRHGADPVPVRHLRLQADAELRFRRGGLRPDGEAPGRRARVPALHVRPELHPRRRGVARGADVPALRRVDPGAQAAAAGRQRRCRGLARPAARARDRVASRSRAGGQPVLRARPAGDRGHAALRERRQSRAFSLRAAALGHAAPARLVRPDRGARLPAPRVHRVRRRGHPHARRSCGSSGPPAWSGGHCCAASASPPRPGSWCRCCAPSRPPSARAQRSLRFHAHHRTILWSC